MESAAPEKSSFQPERREIVAVILVIAALFILHIATYNHYPAVWCDEVSFSEPAVNAVRYGSFTTLTWQHQPLGTFPTVNCPLYSMSLVPWLAATGTSLLSIRSFNYLLISTAALLVWVLSWRVKLVQKPFLRVLLVLALCTGYGMSYSYRCSRPDILGMNLVLLLALALSWRTGALRTAAILLFTAACVWTGLQTALYACFAAFLTWWILRALKFQDLLLTAGGVAFGMGTLALFLWSQAALKNLLEIILGMGGKHYAHSEAAPSVLSSIARVFRATTGAYRDDFSTVAIILGLLLLLPAGWRFLSTGKRKLAILCLALTFGTPALFNIAGHYAFYYSYMIYVPALFASWVVLEELWASPAGPAFHSMASVIWAGTVGGAIAVGLPLRLGLALMCFDLTPRAQVRATIEEHIKPGEVVFSEYTTFFETKNVTRVVYDFWSSEDLMPTHIPGRSFTAEEKSAVNVLVIRPRDRERLTTYFGGDWTAVTGPFGDTQDFGSLSKLPIVGPRFARHAAQPQTERFQVQIYRRTAPK